MDRPKSKQQIRAEIDQEMEQFLQQGGAINKVPRGLSGRQDNLNINQLAPFSGGEKTTRTLLTDTIKLIEERKHKKKEPAKKSQRPRKKIIYDDFGEPIREVWE